MGISLGHLNIRKLTAGVVMAGGLLALGGCAEVSLLGHAATEVNDLSQQKADVAKIRKTRKVGKPYQIKGLWYYPKVDPGYNKTGIASWYGDPFHGRKTANGETYDMNLMTAAHKTLPMPTEVRVTNLENGRSIVVTVNDRGPFVHGRIIDLSRRAAQLLGVIQKGTARVRVETLQSENGDIRYLAKANTAPEESRVASAAPQASVQSSSLTPPSAVKVAPTSKAASKAAPVNTPVGEQKVATLSKLAVVQQTVAPTEIFIQAGAFIDFTNANKLSAALSPLGAAKVYQVLVNGQDFYRVRLGPVYDVTEADQLLAKLINSGHTNARIVIE
ncbi:MAG: septal ring lytic transglycosylase RlpA family protein [Sneathiella sp.]|nr:septal ring lytic transglycosylase RlpA family protein [Sneathiella sp.]